MRRQIALLSCLAVIFVLTSPILATDRLVPSVYPTIQAGINAAVTGDTVIVEPNTYTGSNNRDLDFGGKAITVRSTDPNNPAVVEATIIDCENSSGHRGFYFHSGEDANSVVAGLTIKRGKITSSTDAKGGGIYCTGSSPTIKNCVITNNNASGTNGAYGTGDSGGDTHGGGIYCTSNSDPVIIGCTISNNTASGGTGADSGWFTPPGGNGGEAYGGGIYCSSNSNPTIKDSEISGNKSRGGNGGSAGENEPGSGGIARGGGIYASSVTINECTIKNNKSQGGTGGGPEWYGGDAYGGGTYGGGTIENSILSGNNSYGGDEGPPGGAIQNSGSGYGGGMYCISSSTISNCLIINNLANSHSTGYTGGILDFAGGTQIKNCTICNNTSSFVGGVEGYGGGTTLTDCIVWGNGDDLDGCSATYCCIEDNDSGTGNIHSDPCFVTGWLGDYYLSQTSAGQANNSLCVDAGSDTAANLGMDELTTRIDLVGDEGTVDMGYHYPRINNASVDIDGNGGVDLEDFAILGSQWQRQSGMLLTADVAPLGGDRIVDMCDLDLLVENWLWGTCEPFDPNLNLVAHWKFDEGSGTDANDSSSNENHGTLVGDPCWVSGKIGNYALGFDGDGDYVDIGSNILDSYSEGTITAWVKLNNDTATDGILTANNSADKYNSRNYFYVSSNGPLAYYAESHTDGDECRVETDETLDFDKWYFVAVSVSSTNTCLHIDGSLDSTSSYNYWFKQGSGSGSGTSIYYIGSLWYGTTPTYYFNGVIDDVRVYDRALSAREIWQLYQAGLD